MKLQELIDKVEELVPGNKFDTSTIIKFISDLDRMVTDNILRKHEDTKSVVFDGYDDNTPGETTLLISAPYDEAYIHWVRSKIDLFNMDYERYNNSAAAFYNQYQNFSAFYNREHLPLQRTIKII